MHQADEEMLFMTFKNDVIAFISCVINYSHLFSFLMGLFSPRTDHTLDFLQDNRSFLLLIFNISRLFGTHREYFKALFPSCCSAY